MNKRKPNDMNTTPPIRAHRDNEGKSGSCNCCATNNVTVIEIALGHNADLMVRLCDKHLTQLQKAIDHPPPKNEVVTDPSHLVSKFQPTGYSTQLHTSNLNRLRTLALTTWVELEDLARKLFLQGAALNNLQKNVEALQGKKSKP